MNVAEFDDMGVPMDSSAERCKENARRLQILRERLAVERSETPDPSSDSETPDRTLGWAIGTERGRRREDKAE